MLCKEIAGSVALLTMVATQIIYVSPALACSICQSGDPLAPAGSAKLEAGQAQMALNFEYLTARARSHDDPIFIEELTQMTLRPVFSFSPWSALSAVLQVPVVFKDFSETAPGDVSNRTTPAGLGDVDIGARIFVLSRKNFHRETWHRLGISLGSTFPTGNNDVQENGVRLDEHAQLGIGAFAPYAGLLYSFSQDPWNFFATVNVKRPLTNAYAYRYGAALMWSFAVEYRPLDRLSFGLGLDGRYALADVQDGVTVTNTGGLVVTAAPVLKFNLYDELWFVARAQIPFATHLLGEQSVGPTFFGGVQYTFE
jgi:hypothetical protein